MVHHGSKKAGQTKPYKAAVITASDSCARGEREDLSGPRCKEILENLGFVCEDIIVVPDDEKILTQTMEKFCAMGIDLILTSGGTGFSPRDVTPEATKKVIEKEVPGIAELLRLEGYKKTPKAILSRAVSGIKGQTLIINLPGSVKGVTEGLEALKAVLDHGLEVLRGNVSRCGG